MDTEEYLKIEAGALYDLDADPGEITNIAKSYPEVVARLQDLAQTYVQKLGDEEKPGSEMRKAGYVEVARPMNWKK